MLAKDEISAQVILKSASGKRITGGTLITSDNISEYAPASETVRETRRALRRAGFRVGRMVGISFSITSSVLKFAKFFNVQLTVDGESGVRVRHEPDTHTYEIPLDGLSESMSNQIDAVTFDAPPEFGPPSLPY